MVCGRCCVYSSAVESRSVVSKGTPVRAQVIYVSVSLEHGSAVDMLVCGNLNKLIIWLKFGSLDPSPNWKLSAPSRPASTKIAIIKFSRFIIQLKFKSTS